MPLSQVRNRKMVSAVCGTAMALFLVVATQRIHAQAPATSGPGQSPHIGGNSFEAPKDVVYLPSPPQQDTRLDMYFGDWLNSEPRDMFGTLVVRDILMPGD